MLVLENIMKKRINVILLLLLIVIMATTFVACDSEVELYSAEYWGLDVNSPTTYRRPYAQSDPNNPLDQKSEAIKTMVGVVDHTGRLHKYEHSYGRTLFISISNSESINNLFYDYTLDDFAIREYPWEDSYSGRTYVYPSGIDSYIKVGENTRVKLEELRAQLRDGEIVDLTNIVRVVRIDYSSAHLKFGEEFNGPEYPSEEEWMDMLVHISKLDYVTHIDSQKGFFSTTPTGYNANNSNSWALEKIKVREAWDYTTGSPNVTVGVMDSGVNTTHGALSHAYNGGLSWFPGNGSTEDGVGHGTGVAGIMFAEDSANGVYGVCHDAKFSVLKVNYGGGLEEVDLVIDCLEYAEANGIPIVNFSGGFYTEYVPYCGYIPQDKIELLRNAVANYSGLLVVAAGNERYNLDTSNNKLYPQCFNLPNIIVVGASDQNDQITGSSNYGGTSVDIFAPGDNVYTTKSDGTYESASGTSVAAPLVAGVAALLKSYDPTLSAGRIKQVIIETATKEDHLVGKCVSGGILNARNAFECLYGHDFEATYIDENTHYEECGMCGFRETVDGIKPHSLAYIHNNALSHRYECKCGYVSISYEEHRFKFAGLVGGKQRVECINCGFTKLVDLDVPIVSPNDLLEPKEQTDERYYITASKK